MVMMIDDRDVNDNDDDNWSFAYVYPCFHRLCYIEDQWW